MVGLFFMIFGTLWCAGLISIVYMINKFDIYITIADKIYGIYLIWGVIMLIGSALLSVSPK